jgi:hypothetical protein
MDEPGEWVWSLKPSVDHAVTRVQDEVRIAQEGASLLGATEDLDPGEARHAYAFAARRRAVERVGLQAVRSHRLTQLTQEEQAWREQLTRLAEVQPELTPLVITYVTPAA